MKQETSLGDAVGLVGELLRVHLIEVAKDVLLKNLCMKSCNTVYMVAADDREICHADLAVVDRSHHAELVVVARILCLYLGDEAAVDLLCDLVYTRKQAGEEVDRPFLKRFCHDRMVRVRAALCRDIPCLVPFKVMLVHKKTHELRNSDRRMSVIHLEGCLIRQVLQSAVLSQVLCESLLERS